MRIYFLSLLFTTISACLPAQPSLIPEWKLYYDSAQTYWAKDWNKTIPLLSRAEKSALYDIGLYDENYLTIINDLGLAYAKVSDYPNAEKLLNKVITIKTEGNGTAGADLYRTLLNLATIHAEQGHFEAAEKIYKQIISAQSDGASPDVYLLAVKNLAALYEAHDQPGKALLLIDDSHLIASTTSGDNLLLNYQLQLLRGRLKRKIGTYDEARAIVQGILHELGSNPSKVFESIYIECLQEAGLIDSETGLFNSAEKYLLQAMRLFKSQNPVNNMALTEVLNNLATVYEKIGIREKALVYFQDALALCTQVHGPKSIYTLTLQSNIAGIQLKEGSVDKAIKSFVQIKEILKFAIPDSSAFYITVLNNLATGYRTNKQLIEAQKTLTQAYDLLQKYRLTTNDLAASVMNNLAVVLTANGNAEEAIKYYEKAYALRKNIYGEQSVLLMDLASNMAVVYWGLQRPEKSIPLFQHSIALAVRQVKYIFPNLSEDEQVQFYKKLKEDFERFNTIAFEASAKRPELLTQVFNNQITIKSLLFFTQRHRKDLISEKRDTVLTKQYNLLQSKREQLGYLYQLSLKDLTHAGNSVTDLEREVNVLEKSISMSTSETVAVKLMEQGNQWVQIQAQMKNDEALVEIIRCRKYDLKKYVENNVSRVSFGFTDSVYYAALVTTRETQNNPQLVLIKDGQNMETRFLNYYRNAMTYAVNDQNSYNFYWKPFEHLINTKSTVYLSGDGVYHRLNLNTLLDVTTGKFLIERYNIHYLLNPAQYAEKQNATFAGKRATLVGDPLFDMIDPKASKTRDEGTFGALPGTYTEIVKINEILRSKSWVTEIFLKKQATERNLKNVHSPDILHIATHGFFSTDKIKLSADARKEFLFHSGLVFSGANRSLKEDTQEIFDDGILTAYEVMNLDLTGTHLVVLSACETGLGKLENGEGVYGLQRSFLQAGARNVLISLWKVDDQVTQELMVRFYQYLFQGKPEREALKLAQLDQLKKNPNPSAWGAFIVVGRD